MLESFAIPRDHVSTEAISAKISSLEQLEKERREITYISGPWPFVYALSLGAARALMKTLNPTVDLTPSKRQLSGSSLRSGMHTGMLQSPVARYRFDDLEVISRPRGPRMSKASVSSGSRPKSRYVLTLDSITSAGVNFQIGFSLVSSYESRRQQSAQCSAGLYETEGLIVLILPSILAVPELALTGSHPRGGL